MVYDDAEKLYAEVAKDGKAMFEDAVGAFMPHTVPLAALSNPSFASTWQARLGSSNLPNGKLVGINTVHAPRREVVEVPLTGPGALKLKSEVVQISKDGRRAYALMEHEEGGMKGADMAAGLLSARGMYADLQPVSGEFSSLIACNYQTDAAPFFI